MYANEGLILRWLAIPFLTLLSILITVDTFLFTVTNNKTTFGFVIGDVNLMVLAYILAHCTRDVIRCPAGETLGGVCHQVVRLVGAAAITSNFLMTLYCKRIDHGPVTVNLGFAEPDLLPVLECLWIGVMWVCISSTISSMRRRSMLQRYHHSDDRHITAP